jgi:hypothetical protein
VVLVCLFAPSAGLSMSLASSRRAVPLNIFAWGRSLPAFAAQRGSFRSLALPRAGSPRGCEPRARLSQPTVQPAGPA